LFEKSWKAEIKKESPPIFSFIYDDWDQKLPQFLLFQIANVEKIKLLYLERFPPKRMIYSKNNSAQQKNRYKFLYDMGKCFIFHMHYLQKNICSNIQCYGEWDKHEKLSCLT